MRQESGQRSGGEAGARQGIRLVSASKCLHGYLIVAD